MSRTASVPTESIASPLPHNLVIFDGVCGLCDASVQRLLDWDRGGVLTFTPLQGETFAAIHDRHPGLEPGESIVFLEQTAHGERVYTHSTAIFRITSRLEMPYRALGWFGILPRFLTDAVYTLIARYRLQIWGQLEACRMPTPKERARFLA